MKKGWEKVKFSDLFNDPKKAIISGPFGSNLKSSEYQNQGVPLVRLQNVDRWKFINKNIIYITPEKAEELSSHEYNSGDILISKLGDPLGKACIAPESSGVGIVLADIVRVRVDDNSHDKEFIVYQLNSEDISIQLKALTTGATRPRVTLKSIRELNFVIPTLTEQKQIVAILDKAFTAIDQAKANIEKNIQNAQELFQSKLNDIFSQKGGGWKEKSLGDNTLLIMIDGDRGKNYPKKTDFLEKGHCVFMNTGNVRPNGFDFSKVVFLTEERDNLLRKGKLQREDIVMTTRGTIGNLGWYNSHVEYEHIRINSGMLIFRVNQEKILPEYLFTLFRSSVFKQQIEEKTSGAAQPQLPIKTLVTFKIPINQSLIEQKKMVKLIGRIDLHQKKLIENYTNKILNLNDLKKSILQKAFEGDLTH